nr:DUF2290 domain-containing protein [uncultured Trichococcus sp.]
MAKKKSNVDLIIREILLITEVLIEQGLSMNQNYPKSFTKSTKKGPKVIVAPSGDDFDSRVFFDPELSYSEMYKILIKDNAYNIKLIDGAILSLYYELSTGGSVMNHRLIFFPSTELLSLEDDNGMDLSEDVYSDIINQNIYPFPLRLDFDLENAISIDHPASHLTLGQYKNCRIPATAPVTPLKFIKFILRNFYYNFYKDRISVNSYFDQGYINLDDTIKEEEKTNLSYFVI